MPPFNERRYVYHVIVQYGGGHITINLFLVPALFSLTARTFDKTHRPNEKHVIIPDKKTRGI